MSDLLYQEALKALAQSAHGAGRLEAPDKTLRLDNPLCGDRITVDLAFDGERIRALGHETKGCLLCRAAAALLAREAPGRSRADLQAMPAVVEASLGGDPAVWSWPGQEAFAPVRDVKSRWGCVLLPFRAVAKLLESG